VAAGRRSPALTGRARGLAPTKGSSRVAKIGVLTFSDGREFVHRDMVDTNEAFQTRLANRLAAEGHEVVTGEIVWSADSARTQARRLVERGCDATIFNYAVWAFPHFTAIASQFAPRPILAFSNVNPTQPGLVGMLAAAGALNQLGVPFERVWGNVEDEATFAVVRRFCRAAGVVSQLRNETYGLIGGRPMGMYSAVSNTDDWMRQFGIDIEHIDQWEIVRRGEGVDPAKVKAGREWLEGWGNVHYDGDRLTPALLERQVRSYYAVQELVQEWDLAFCGIKGQPELTNNYCTMDVTEAFMNDAYDWDGPKETVVCATEADSDAALTMQILKHLAATPVLFADVRHYHEQAGFFDLVNSGQHATYFAGASLDPERNMPSVHFHPEVFFFPAGGASVQHLAAPGRATFARLTRKDGRYWMAILPGELIQFDAETNERYMRETTWEWPHAFARFDAAPETVLGSYASNHVHAVYGDQVDDLIAVCRALDVTPVLYDATGARDVARPSIP
jgi:L-fucose/D-arabinose isomerase